MADIAATAGASARGCRLDWSLHFDDSADTITINATHVKTIDGTPAPTPQQAQITLQINSGASIALDLLTGDLTPGGLFDGQAGDMLNTGDRTRTNVRLRVSATRAQLITFSTQYLPPAA